MDAPFPTDMMPGIERFFRDVHPTLQPGQNWYPEVFDDPWFFPLQRQRELAAMIQIARQVNPVTICEIGTDKGGGLYHWCQCLPTVKNVIACEIRGTPYSNLFGKAFPVTSFHFLPQGSAESVNSVQWFLSHHGKIDVLFIDGDKRKLQEDFDAYLPLMRQPGGVVFMHDIQDDHPAEAFKVMMNRGYRTKVIIEKLDAYEAMDLEERGIPARTAHEQWLRHWQGRSCGVGVIYL